jgi:hydroxymethylpyrimidine pyrophosphatase-like HAD family hydrolase
MIVDTLAFRPIATQPLLLATDLDGTFLGGDRPDRQQLYRTIETQRDRWRLVFVTGRSLAQVAALYADPETQSLGLPRPDVVIGDVGTTVVDFATGQPVEPVQRWIAETWETTWGQVGDRLTAWLASVPGLDPQPGSFRYRRSYYCDPTTVPPDVLQQIETAGCDWILSDGRFLDILPRGVSKGPVLRRLIATWDFGRGRPCPEADGAIAAPMSSHDPRSRHLRSRVAEVTPSRSPRLSAPETLPVIVAGDTLNDQSLLASGYRAIAVGNAEAGLLDAVGHLPTVYRSDRPGAGGILDGCRHFGLVAHLAIDGAIDGAIKGAIDGAIDGAIN